MKILVGLAKLLVLIGLAMVGLAYLLEGES